MRLKHSHIGTVRLTVAPSHRTGMFRSPAEMRELESVHEHLHKIIMEIVSP